MPAEKAFPKLGPGFRARTILYDIIRDYQKQIRLIIIVYTENLLHVQTMSAIFKI
jgi:hypothetical protein